MFIAYLAAQTNLKYQHSRGPPRFQLTSFGLACICQLWYKLLVVAGWSLIGGMKKRRIGHHISALLGGVIGSAFREICIQVPLERRSVTPAKHQRCETDKLYR